MPALVWLDPTHLGQALPAPAAKWKPGICTHRLHMAGVFHFYHYLPWDCICIHRGFKRISPHHL